MNNNYGFILFIIASILLFIFLPIAFIYTMCTVKCRKTQYKHVAKSLDQHANAVGWKLWNLLWLKGSFYPFGHEDETLSSVFGKNKENKSLNSFGKFVCKVLNKLDNNHVERAVDETISN